MEITTPINDATITENAVRVLAREQLTPAQRHEVFAATARGDGEMVRGANEIYLRIGKYVFTLPVVSLVKPRNPSLN